MRSLACSFLVELWLNWPETITEEYAEYLLRMLKYLVRIQDRGVQYTAIAQMFKLLEVFTSQKNSAAPVIYKALIFVLVESHEDDTTRQFMMSNFSQFFEISETIPVGILLEPLIKQFVESEGTTYKYNTFDFEFFVTIVKHPKMKLNDAIPLMDALAKIYLNDPVFCFAASIPFMMIITKFIDSLLLLGYVKKFVTLALSMLLSADPNQKEVPESQRTKKRIPLPLPPSRARRSAKDGHKPLNRKAMDEKLKKIAIIEICKKLVGLQNIDLNELIESLCLSIIVQLDRNNPNSSQYDKGLLSILDLFGNANEIIESFERAEAERMQREAEAEEGSRMLEKVDELDDEQEETRTVQRRGHSRDSRKFRDYESDGIAKKGSRRVGSLKRGVSENDNMAVVPYLQQKPKNKIERKAFADLERIRKQREEENKKRDIEKEKQKLIEEKRKKKLKKQIELRRVELGVQKRKGDEDKSALLFKEGEVEKTAGFGDFTAARGLQPSVFNASTASRFSKLNGIGKRFSENFKGPEVMLFDYDAEEQRDIDAVKIVVKKYTKLFKYLFNKYANSGYSVQAFRDFEELNKKLQTITTAEIMKMLRDHHITNRIIGKTKVSEIVRLVQPNSTPLPLTYSIFVEFFIQLAYVIYTGPPNNMIHLTPADTLLKLISSFEEAARSKGQSTLLYEDPDATSLGDKKVLDELNRRIKVNPSYSLPEGYTKVIEKDFNYEYTIPDYYDISEAQRISILVLDSLCEKLFDIHFIEPMVKYQEIVRVRPTFKKQLQQQREPLQYMKKPERRNKLDPISHPSDNSRKGSSSTLDTSESQVELSTALKIEIGRYPFDKRPTVTKCAEVLEEILAAVSDGRSTLKSRSRAQPAFRINKVEKQRLEDENQEKIAQKRKEEKRRKREQELKEQMRKLTEQREKEQRERQQKLEEAEKAEIERRKEEQKRAKLAKEKKRKQLEEAKKQREEELLKLKEQEEEQEKKKQAELKKKNKEFLKMQNQKLKQQFAESKKEREAIEKRELELQEKEKLKQQKMKEEMEDFLHKNKDSRKLELKERTEIAEFYSTPDVQALMQLYEEQLMHLYKYYTLQGNVSIGGDLEKRMNVIEFNNWVKFGHNTNITPHLISTDDMVAIYRTLEREMDAVVNAEEKMEEVNYIDFELFKKGLIRITILTKTQSIEAEVKQRQRRRRSTKKGQELDDSGAANKIKSNKLKELEEQIAKIEKLQKIKIEEKRVSKEFDVSLINIDDVERLFKFLQLNPDDDKYTMDKKITNKSGYPKMIVFEGLEGSYSDTHSIRDNSSSYRQKREPSRDEDRYSVIHKPNKQEPSKQPEEQKIKDAEKSQTLHESKTKDKKTVSKPKESSVADPEKETPKPKENSKLDESVSSKKEEPPKAKKLLVAVDEDELNNQPADSRLLENIIDPEGKKEEWKVDQD